MSNSNEVAINTLEQGLGQINFPSVAAFIKTSYALAAFAAFIGGNPEIAPQQENDIAAVRFEAVKQGAASYMQIAAGDLAKHCPTLQS